MMKMRFWKISLMVALGISGPTTYALANQGGSQWEIRQNDPRKHTVQKGETLYAISRMYNVTVDEITNWNALDGTGLSIGQVLIVSPPEQAPTPPPPPKVEKVETETKEVVSTPPVSDGAKEHTVGAGETLYSIARQYDMSVGEIKRLNQLTDASISIGQKLKLSEGYRKPISVKEEATPANPNQGVSLMTMIKDTVEEDPEENVEVEMDVLKVDSKVEIAPDALVENYTDDNGKRFKRVTERGTAGQIADFSTDQTKFYAFHKYLPVGSYIRVDYPDRSQSILCEVRSSISKDDDNVVLLTAKCLEYLRMNEPGEKVILRYVVPIK